jgi:archaetidylinositol phosphate synthase
MTIQPVRGKQTDALPPVQRIQSNLLAANERRLLTWLSARMPAWVTPDKLTATGFAGSLIISAGYGLSGYNTTWLWIAILGYFINWFGDSLDGSLARFRKIERPKFGYFIDHSMDSLGNMIVMAGLATSPYVRFDIAMFGISAYLLLSIHTFLAARVLGEFRLSYVSAGPTELRIVLIGMTLCMMWWGTRSVWSVYSPFDLFIGGLGVMLIIAFIIQTARTAQKLVRSGE